jgi:potassium efflux system protein
MHHHLSLASSCLTRILLLISLYTLGYGTPLFAQQEQVPADSSQVIPDTLLFRLEKVRAAINQVNTDNKKGYNLEAIAKGLSHARANVSDIGNAMKPENSLPGSKDLGNYRMILTDIIQLTEGWRKSLSQDNAKLQHTSELIIAFSGDSLLRIDENDPTHKKLYADQIVGLKEKMQMAGAVTVANLDSVSRMLADVSAVNFEANDLRNLINEYIREAGQNVLNREASFLWETSKQRQPEHLGKLIRTSYSGQDKIIRYFFSSKWDNRIMLILSVVAFFMWLYVNFRLIAKPALAEKCGPLSFEYIKPVPITATLIFLFSVTPLFEPNAPAIYIEFNQFFLMIAVSALFLKRLHRHMLKRWFVILIFYLLIVLSNGLVSDNFYLRSILIIINVISVYLGWVFYRKAKGTEISDRYEKPVLMMYMIFNLLAIILNVLGRISLAKTFNITAISGVLQLVCLSVFVSIIMEAMELHVKVSAGSKRLFSKINFANSRASFKKGLIVLSVFLWILSFTINLNILNGVYGFVQQILTTSRSLGSISFTFGNVLYFSIIIFLANKIQKNVGVFFGESDLNFNNNAVQKGSRLTLIRLVIIVVGFLFAVMVSGIPIDKLTVLLGALGVGIGLGMQNIINNFVSGIILIFEKPFSIGDYVELADKKGKILEIGIRSSTMLTLQGSRVIIPNGDLLSGRLVNYTMKNARLKSELTFKVHIETDITALKKLIDETVDKLEGSVKKAPKQILVSGVGADSVEIKVMVWLESVYQETAFKSNLLEQLLSRFQDNGIKIM